MDPHAATVPRRDDAQSLRGLALFHDLDDGALEVLTDAAEWLHIEAQQVLFEAGDTADSMYVVVAGRLDVFRRGEGGSAVVVARIPPGEPVGELGLLSGAPRTASV